MMCKCKLLHDFKAMTTKHYIVLGNEFLYLCCVKIFSLPINMASPVFTVTKHNNLLYIHLSAKLVYDSANVSNLVLQQPS